jgi:hypothetical protein
MHRADAGFETLAMKARRGDVGAAATLQQQLEPHLKHIIRHALRQTDGGDNPLAHRVWEEISGLGRNSKRIGVDDPEQLAGWVARRMAQSIRANLEGGKAQSQGFSDTVVGE